jgi:ATP-dependent exoDNAse (exonuclease V) beta subunit
LFDPDLGILLPEKDEEGNKGASYQLGEWRANKQEDAEAARLLYVALTRAEQVLLISGHFKVTTRGRFSMGGWLKQLATETGLLKMDLSDFDLEGAKMHRWERLVGETAVRAAFFEPEFPFDLAAEPAQSSDSPAIQPLSPLQKPLASTTAVEKETTRHVWQVVPVSKRPTAPAWVVGSLVHDALASWRFPDDGFADWVTARAWQFGLSDDDQLADARRESGKLLHGFQESAIYREITAADWRRHELVYTLSADGKAKTGKIDLLYRVGERWVLVDFKTDRLRDQKELARKLQDADYVKQVRQYGRAVQELIGVTPELRLCFLNVGGAVLVEKVGL